MKQFVILVAAAVVAFSSCKKKELESISVLPSTLAMHYDESKQLEAGFSPSDLEIPPVFVWSSENEMVAEVDQDGTVNGVKVGETNILLETSDKKFNATCKIEITPISNLYKEPVLGFGKNKAFVKDNEPRKLATEIADALLYEGENTRIRNVMYSFDGGKLDAATAMLANEVYVAEEAMIYLDERYDYQFVSKGVRFYFKGENKEIAIGLTVDDSLGLVVMYFENPTKKSGSSLEKQFNSIIEQIKLSR